jgi:uncharacterized membrane protein
VILVYLPVPVRLEVSGLPNALFDTLNVPALAPFWAGVNTTLMVQLALDVKFAWQLVVETPKSPVVEITMLWSIVFRLFLSVNTLAALVVPTVVRGKFALTGVNVTAALPVPDRATVCGLFDALS